MTLDAALFFLGGIARARACWVIEFDAPTRECLLSSYRAWQEIVHSERENRPTNLSLVFNRQSANRGTRMYRNGRPEPDAYQICVPVLRRQWVRDVRPLKVPSGSGLSPARKLSSAI